jgi:hypothetical protein
VTAVRIEVKGLERCLGKYLADHDIYRGLHGHLCKFDIQYKGSPSLSTVLHQIHSHTLYILKYYIDIVFILQKNHIKIDLFIF